MVSGHYAQGHFQSIGRKVLEPVLIAESEILQKRE